MLNLALPCHALFYPTAPPHPAMPRCAKSPCSHIRDILHLEDAGKVNARQGRFDRVGPWRQHQRIIFILLLGARGQVARCDALCCTVNVHHLRAVRAIGPR